MRRMMLPLILCVGMACQPSGVDRQATTTGPEVEAITAWFEQYIAAINRGDLEDWMTFVADDAVVMPPDELPISGMDELRPRYEAVFATYAFQFSARVDEVVVAGDLAVLRAFYEETVTPKGEGEPSEFSGSWLMVLRKQSDGSWKLWRNMWGVIPAPPTNASR
ncbi:MAG: SgcJ/EcaC family oxidoreductase [Gemmatimonadota bacterium]|nr:MAG: SgcJ/EcaC family oxidoreductase [Gemmatimonadota bacterium]